jgi:hypothetical protein
MTRVKWDPLRNLDSHYHIHPCKPAEYGCWIKLTREPSSPITRDRYEAESVQVVNNAWLVLDADFENYAGDDPTPVRYFFDSRSCFTSVSRPSHNIRTCFHWHTKEGGCDITATYKSKTNVLKRLVEKRFSPAGRISNVKIDKASLQLNVDEKRLLKSYLDEIEGSVRRVRSS